MVKSDVESIMDVLILCEKLLRKNPMAQNALVFLKKNIVMKKLQKIIFSCTLIY